jgi:hypothetical protein
VLISGSLVLRFTRSERWIAEMAINDTPWELFMRLAENGQKLDDRKDFDFNDVLDIGRLSDLNMSPTSVVTVSEFSPERRARM